MRICLLVDEGKAVGAKDVENDAGVPRVALSGSWLLDKARENYRQISALIQVDKITKSTHMYLFKFVMICESMNRKMKKKDELKL